MVGVEISCNWPLLFCVKLKWAHIFITLRSLRYVSGIYINSIFIPIVQIKQSNNKISCLLTLSGKNSTLSWIDGQCNMRLCPDISSDHNMSVQSWL